MNEFSLILLKWFHENGRDLPWRKTSDPYAIWLSEIILQQTQVKQGWDYWERFMRRWPTVDLLAAASEDEVLREWQGLGYYSRARNLHFAAKQIVEMGGFPTTLEGIKSLKGVGDYTAAAIGSIAFGLPAAVVDGNVYRVLSRHFGISTPINTTEGKKEFALLAQNLLLPALDRAGQGAGLYNQAIMDFGAIQCTPSSPRCADCPLMETCMAFREGRVAQLPVKLKTLKVKERRLTYVYVRYQGETAIRRRGKGDIWQGLYEPLLFEEESSLSPLTTYLSPLKKNVKHVLTHRILWADFYLWEPIERPQLPEDYFWIKEAELDDFAKPRLVEILLDNLIS
ncbi:A/G-specific adenine glycosylase [Prevotella sp. E2-28]|uniref:A/G-specific adenine glycosylase n=1 Tax=Prevotella sp. E2-28 TaxID=2913620 RepID=UPI001EDBE549|nr:A/G-specific adenine glycosylase [Prevotella sp. E2-28]UKK53238.1 A/G-specific adenine glycosylase [Prevotella sp. E2-28]